MLISFQHLEVARAMLFPVIWKRNGPAGLALMTPCGLHADSCNSVQRLGSIDGTCRFPVCSRSLRESNSRSASTTGRHSAGHRSSQDRTATGVPTSTPDPPGLTPITVPKRYCDLDLMIMGVKTAWEAYHSDQWAFHWISPRLTAPLEYLVGIFVAFAPDDYHYFGFLDDHRTLGVQRTGQAPTVLSLGPNYRPLDNVALRIVRKGNAFYFQARFDNPERGCFVPSVISERKQTASAIARANVCNIGAKGFRATLSCQRTRRIASSRTTLEGSSPPPSSP